MSVCSWTNSTGNAENPAMNLEDHDQSHGDVETTGVRKVSVEAYSEPLLLAAVLEPLVEPNLEPTVEVPTHWQAQQSLAVGQRRRSALRGAVPRATVLGALGLLIVIAVVGG